MLNRSINPHFRVQYIALIITFLTWALGIIPFKLYNFFLRGSRDAGILSGGSNYQSIPSGSGTGNEGNTATTPSGDVGLLDPKGNETENRLVNGFLLFFAVFTLNYLLGIHNIAIDAIFIAISILQTLVVASYWIKAQKFGDLCFHVENVLTLILIFVASFGQGDIIY